MFILTEYFPEFMGGLWTTVVVSFFAFAGALLLGLIGALMRRSRYAVVRAVALGYVEVIRNTPLLVQVFLIYFGLPAFGIVLSPIVAGSVALAINVGAYLVEIFRVGIDAVPNGPIEAARTLGLKKHQIYSAVVLPQAARIVYPAVVNELLQIILGTSLLSVISLNEITGVALIVNSLTFETMQVFTIAMVLYLILTISVSALTDVFSRVYFKPPLASVGRTAAKSLLRRLVVIGGGR